MLIQHAIPLIQKYYEVSKSHASFRDLELEVTFPFWPSETLSNNSKTAGWMLSVTMFISDRLNWQETECCIGYCPASAVGWKCSGSDCSHAGCFIDLFFVFLLAGQEYQLHLC